MGKGMQRRTVYAATVLAMLALTAGFVMAASLGGIVGPASVNQNAGTITTTSNTMFATSVNVNLVQATLSSSSGCDVSVAWATSGTPGTLSVYATGTNTCTSGGASSSTDWFEEVSWTAVTVPTTSGSSITDTFYVTTSGGASPNTVTFTVTTPANTATGTGALNLYLDMGPTVTGGIPQSPTSYTGISIAVNQV
jgi:hypothetical protein